MQRKSLEQFGVVPVDFSALATLLSDYKSPKSKIAAMERSGDLIRLKKGLFIVSPEEALCTDLIFFPFTGITHLTNLHKQAANVLNELQRTLLTILCSLMEFRYSEFLSVFNVTGPSLHSPHSRYSAAICCYSNVLSVSGPKGNLSIQSTAVLKFTSKLVN